MSEKSRINLGDAHYAGMIILLRDVGDTECYRCRKPIEGDYAHCYQWIHRVRDDPSVSSLLLFCSERCLIDHLKADSLELVE